MFSKVFFVVAVLAGASAQKHEASSYSSINIHGADAQNDYHHAPALVKTSYAAPTVFKAAPAVIKAPVYHAAPAVIKTPVVGAYNAHHEEYPDAHPHYSFEYGVNDEHTHDIHNQHEERDGDVVKGYYSLVQPDGVTRTVHYSADHHNGFNAQVEYSGHADHPQVQKAAVVAAAPVYHAPAPVHHAYPHH